MSVPYAAIRRDAFRLAEADAHSSIPPIAVRIGEVDQAAIRTWRCTWKGIHPSGYGGFEWDRLWFRYCRSSRSFSAGLWHDEILCGLAIGTIPAGRTRLTLRYMEAKPNPPNPLLGHVMRMVAAAAEYYSRGLALPLLEVENPAPGLVGRYRAQGFVLAYSRAGARYLGKQL